MRGKITGWHKGYGWAQPDDGGRDVILPAANFVGGNVPEIGSVVEFTLDDITKRSRPRATRVRVL